MHTALHRTDICKTSRGECDLVSVLHRGCIVCTDAREITSDHFCTEVDLLVEVV